MIIYIRFPKLFLYLHQKFKNVTMPGVNKIMHKGKEIFLIDYSGTVDDNEMITILKKAQQIIINDNKEYLQLVDIRNAHATSKYMNEAKQVARETPKLATKRAIVGITPMKKIILTSYNFIIGGVGLKPFSTLEEAKDYLVQ